MRDGCQPTGGSAIPLLSLVSHACFRPLGFSLEQETIIIFG